MVCPDANEGMDLAVRVRASRQRESFLLIEAASRRCGTDTGESFHLEVPNPNPVI